MHSTAIASLHTCDCTICVMQRTTMSRMSACRLRPIMYSNGLRKSCIRYVRGTRQTNSRFRRCVAAYSHPCCESLRQIACQSPLASDIPIAPTLTTNASRPTCIHGGYLLEVKMSQLPTLQELHGQLPQRIDRKHRNLLVRVAPNLRNVITAPRSTTQATFHCQSHLANENVQSRGLRCLQRCTAYLVEMVAKDGPDAGPLQTDAVHVVV